ncbi:MAG: DNA mismatch repair protein MutS [Bacteroidia bacterium]|jgi:DNA mismatch repair protein MutS|nr:DNA mismatch repair protein MutS [Bacteroidia bacterium]
MAKKETVQETPLMKQYFEIKSKYPGAILLFRVGDFYETFGEDAVKAAHILGIVLTKRANGSASHVELAGFPHHSLDTYLPKLVRAGERVAICDQLEDPKLTKKIVKRGVTELVTPGVSYNDKVLEHKSNNYLCAVYFHQEQAGVAFVDISTGEFLCGQGNIPYIEKLIQGLKPAEILISKKQVKTFKDIFGDKLYTYLLDEWVFAHQYAYDKLIAKFETVNLKGFGIQEMELAIITSGVCLHYLNETHHQQLGHIQTISRLDEDRYMWLDRFTIKNLELLSSTNENGSALVDVIDKTTTPMGARLLKRWLVMPLKDIQLINERHNSVSAFTTDEQLCNFITNELKPVGDLERMVSKLAMRRINPRELWQLNKSLKQIEPIKQQLINSNDASLTNLGNLLQDCSWVTQKITSTIKPDPPLLANRGDIINDNIHTELDNLRKIAFNGKDYLLNIQQKEQERTGIPSLKIAFNNVFGYYLEVTNTHKNKVPPEWIRKQTLTNAERYITQELKTYEDQILGAEEKIAAIEELLYQNLITELGEYVQILQQNALAIGKIDCLVSFARLSMLNKYTRPELTTDGRLFITAGRHPVIEKQLPPGEPYIPNDILLDKNENQIIILTGPNMAGKSAILRQCALITILAQIGCFVPATAASVSITDKIFTRVGASDNLSSGESTFMVEMTETASILNNISENSLVLLDEIGRGTSTYDGVSIAWAIAEFLAKHPSAPRTLFATHYHELNELESQFSNIHNYHIQIKESGQKIIFLRTLAKGGSEHSFGIHVAKMAGVPQLVVQRANHILAELEKQRGTGVKQKSLPTSQPLQLAMFEMNDPLMTEIKADLKELDINTITPVEALMKLHEIIRKLK